MGEGRGALIFGSGVAPIITPRSLGRQARNVKKPAHRDKKQAVHVKKEAFPSPPGHVPFGIPFMPEVKMSVRKAVSLVMSLAIVGLAACADVAGPQPEGFCTVVGGSGTCVATSQK